LFDKVGLGFEVMLDEYKTIGLPLVDAHAEFLAPTRFGDEIEITSHVSEWRRKTLVVSHEISNNGSAVVRGTEVRVWAATDPDDSRKLQSMEIPPEFRTRLDAT
jgi:4-hydroxybenzoyl-CoA thioesterase